MQGGVRAMEIIVVEVKRAEALRLFPEAVEGKNGGAALQLTAAMSFSKLIRLSTRLRL
jgi:hypothetical protein